jgi:hypothetical protein
MDARKISELILEDRRQWQILVSVLDAYSSQTLHGTPDNPWKSRDVYAHLARWLEHSNRNMEAYIRGAGVLLTFDNPLEMNEIWKMEDYQMTLAAAREKAQRAFEERIRILHSIPLEKWDIKLEKIVAYDGAEHYKAHRQYINMD